MRCPRGLVFFNATRGGVLVVHSEHTQSGKSAMHYASICASRGGRNVKIGRRAGLCSVTGEVLLLLVQKGVDTAVMCFMDNRKLAVLFFVVRFLWAFWGLTAVYGVEIRCCLRSRS